MIGPPVPPPPVVSSVYLVGQAPGPHEADIGRPFAWTAGRTLFRWFATLGVDEAAFRSRIGSPRERELLRPRLILPVGRLAISRFLGDVPLVDVIGRVLPHDGVHVVPLPHPSGVSTWFKKEPDASLLIQALARIGEHPAWRETFPDHPPG